MCVHCAAPLHVEVMGERVSCPYCRGTCHFAARNEVKEYVEPGVEQMTEAQRMQMLASQSPFSLPNGLESGDLPEQYEHLSMAWQGWQAQRGIFASYGRVSDEDLFFRLTCHLHRKLMLRNEHHRRRALLESSVEVTSRPRYRQLLRCMIARNAALFGDTRAAREWVAPCNARPLDLYMDSAYRVTIAGIDIAGRHYDDALRQVGRQLGEVPMARSYADLSDLYRAAAIELSGDVAGATEQLIRCLKGFARRAATRSSPATSAR